MKHIKTYDEAVNEGFLGWLFKKIYKVNFTAELVDKKTNEPFSYKSYLTVKAKDEDEAREKFDDKWEKATKGFDPEPDLIVGNIKKTDKADKINIELPKSVTKLSKEKEEKKEVKGKKEEAEKKKKE
jgi:hypothetical protein